MTPSVRRIEVENIEFMFSYNFMSVCVENVMIKWAANHFWPTQPQRFVGPRIPLLYETVIGAGDVCYAVCGPHQVRKREAKLRFSQQLRLPPCA
jgi:hypothetical protein